MPSPYEKFIKDELTDHIIYMHLAAQEKNPENKKFLLRLAEQEDSHRSFWQSLAPDAHVSANPIFIRSILFLRWFFGVTFTTKLLELHEGKVIEEYKSILLTLPAARQEKLKKIIDDEITHEKTLLGQLKEKRVHYLGFIALGLADAIVEITGVHAGFLGITGSTLVAGISGLTVGFAAAISMGSAAYIQAKQDPEKSPMTSAIATGISYLLSVILLALPYFFTSIMIVAFTISTIIGLALLAGLTFYGAVIFDRLFIREFAESAILMLATAGATFLFGTIIGKIFHVGMTSF